MQRSCGDVLHRGEVLFQCEFSFRCSLRATLTPVKRPLNTKFEINLYSLLLHLKANRRLY